MYNSIHSKFIKTPIFEILKDGVNACRGIGCGMEAYPLRDYILQSLFLRMTGAQEQKLKCICWEMATNDYGYRYEFINTGKKDFGGFSKYEQKSKVYILLIEEIKKYNERFNIDTFEWIRDVDSDFKEDLFNQEVSSKVAKIISKKEENQEILSEENKIAIRQNIEQKSIAGKDTIIIQGIKRKFIESIKDNMIALMDSSLLAVGDWCNYSHWKNDTELIIAENCALGGDLLMNDLKATYVNDVIKHRHRCAHNLTSYQQNLPTFDTISENNYRYYNYFFRFAILILIDEIFIRIYDEYLYQIENNPFPII